MISSITLLILPFTSRHPMKPDYPHGLLEHHFLWRQIQAKGISSSDAPYCGAAGRTDDFLLDLAASRPLFTVLGWFLSSKRQRQVAVSIFNSAEPPRAQSLFEKSVGTKNGSNYLKEVITCNSKGCHSPFSLLVSRLILAPGEMARYMWRDHISHFMPIVPENYSPL